MLTSLLAYLLLARAGLGQSLVDNAKHHAMGEGEADLLDIQWMLVGHRTTSPSPHMLAISFNGRTAVSGGDIDRTLKIWDVERHVLKRTIVCYGLDKMTMVDISQDGELVLAGSAHLLKVYRSVDGVLLATLPVDGLMAQAKFTADTNVAIRLSEGAPPKTYTLVVGYRNGQRICDMDNLGDMVEFPISPDRRWLFGHDTAVGVIHDELLKKDIEHISVSLTWLDILNEQQSSYAIEPVTLIFGPGTICVKDNTLVTPVLRSGNERPNGMFLLWVGFQKMNMNIAGPVPFAGMPARALSSSDGGTFLLEYQSTITHKTEVGIFDSESFRMYSRIRDITYESGNGSLALGRLGLIGFKGNSEYTNYRVLQPPVIDVWSSQGTRMRGFLDNGSSVCDLVVSDDGKTFAISTSEGRVKIFERESGAYLQLIDCPYVFWSGQMVPALMQDLVFGKDYVAGASPGPHVFVRPLGKKDIKAKHLIDPDTGWSDIPVMCGYDEGKKILVATPKSKLGLRLMETVSGRVLKTYLPKVPLTKVERAGDYVAGIQGKTIYVWNIESGQLANKIVDEFVSICTLRFSGKHLFAGGEDGTITCYELLKSKKVVEFKGHEAPIVAMDVSPDGRTLVSRSNDAYEEYPLRVWDVESGKLLHKYKNEIGPIEPTYIAGNAIRFTPDGKYFLFGRGDGSVVYVKLDAAAPPEEPKEIDKPKVLVSGMN